MSMQKNNQTAFTYTMIGNSMLPLFEDNRTIVTITKQYENIKPLDLILYKTRKKQHLISRVIKNNNKYLYVCADNANRLTRISKEDIIGIVIGYQNLNEGYISIHSDIYKLYLDKLNLNYRTRMIIKPIDKDIKDFISLISSTINQTTIVQNDFNFENIYKIADNHKMAAFIFKTIDIQVCSTETYKKFKDSYNIAIKRTILFDNERNIIIRKLIEKDINYLPLKGIVVNHLYPQYGTRFFTDNDILVSDKQKAIEIMKNLGYELKSQANYVLDFKKDPIYNFELHLKPFYKDDRTKNYYDYFSDTFSIARKVGGNEYELSNEDLIAYLLGHLHKHMVNGGAGIRFYVDFYYINKKLVINKTKLMDLLKELNLLELYEYVLNIIDKLFIKNEYPIEAINRIFVGSTFGSKDYKIDEDVNHYGKLRYSLIRLFPSRNNLAYCYPIVDKYPILTPICWILRLLNPTKYKNAFYELKRLLSK